MKAEPPPKTSAMITMNAADWWLAIEAPMIAATNATKTSPSRNIVTVIRTVRPRSGAYLVRVAMMYLQIDPGSDPVAFVPVRLVLQCQAISVTLGAGSRLPLRPLKATAINCAHGEAAAAASPARPGGYGDRGYGAVGAAREVASGTPSPRPVAVPC